ncbi:MAG: hypothetical protein LUD79_05410, partial [Oscillospiraceae bacterium]|nr:hypothetical protein [Oscillospiraceae bacterium]
MKRFISLFCAAGLLVSLAACGSQNSTSETETATAATEDYSNSELTGEVTAIDGTTITLTLGELTEADMSSGGGEAPGGDGMEKPDGTGAPDGEEMEMPEGTGA